MVEEYSPYYPELERWRREPQKAPHIGHNFHLCNLCENGSCTLEQVKNLVVPDPKFLCKKCGRVAKAEENLCEPVTL